MSTAAFDALPSLLAEIAEVVAEELGSEEAGLTAALAVARARGGQRVRILPVLADNAWLIDAVGAVAAQAIVAFFAAGSAGEQIDVPQGHVRGHNAMARQRRTVIEAGLAAGMKVDDIAREADCTRRWVFRVQERLAKGRKDTRQLGLFDERAA